MPHATAKDLLREAVDRLPESASVEDAMERLLCLAKIERGRDDIAAGRLVEHEDVKRRFLQPQHQLLQQQAAAGGTSEGAASSSAVAHHAIRIMGKITPRAAK